MTSGTRAGTPTRAAYPEHLREAVEAHLAGLRFAHEPAAAGLEEAMRYSLLAGGKRIRPVLALATAKAISLDVRTVLPLAAALELIHTYSLIHDDLPAMDDDDLRRGRPTAHVRFGEATAILAGDALQALAFQTIAADGRLDAGTRVRLVAELARAAGTPDGMVAGQAQDLAAEARDGVTGEELELIHRRKTGALIASAARCGAISAGASAPEIESVGLYAARLGLLFQITDDLLDVTATAADLGKTPGKDARSQKATYPALYGLDAARERARAAYNEALRALDALDRDTRLLRSLARLTLERRA
ncbi:MAG TPA: farnesyl diphosphate synthase [Pyrinomonadaceae bacterium]|nr:farnesyl diphosphate synthase [Pyrinomonadaceae bacterium]